MPLEMPLVTTFVAAFVLAFILGFIANKANVSPIIGYLLAGIAVGPYTPGFVADIGLSKQLAELGVILLMFGVGLHFSVEKLIEVRWVALPGALGQVAAATAMGAAFGAFLGWSLTASLVFGVSLSVASTVVMLRALEEQGLIETKRGRIAVGWLVVEDLIMILVLVIVPIVASLSADASELAFGDVALTISTTVLKVTAFMAAMIVVGPRVVPWLLDRVAMTGSRELFTLSVLALALGIAYISAEVAGASFALGAFFAGMILAGSKLSQNAAERSLPLRDAFAVLFFVAAGMLFNPQILVTQWPAVIGVTLIIVFGKSLAAFFIVTAFGYPGSTAAMVAVSLAQVGEFSFILAAFSLKLNVIPQDAHDLILAGAILSIMLNPALFFVVNRYGGMFDRLAPGRAEAPPLVSEVAYDLRDHAIVVGYGRVGQRVVQRLRDAGAAFVVVEPDRDRSDLLIRSGHRSVCGAADRPEALLAAGVKAAKTALIAVPSSYDAVGVVRQVRTLNPDIRIISRAGFDAEREHLLASGADLALIPETEIADAMVAAADVVPGGEQGSNHTSV
ncbi:MAG: YbaL family putative K(+) efflux transporter [Hyphomicrobiales bacterium]|nr:YbaL family putative K(+) efflux transporter [Hyphomicrobiales bacterium]